MPPKKQTATKTKTATLPRVIAIHRTFDETKKGETVFFVAEQGEKVKKLIGTKLDAFLNSIGGTMRIRVTTTGQFLPILARMQDAGAVIETAHWHATGISKGMSPEEIATAFVNLSPLVMKPVKLREDIHTLRQLVNMRQAVVETRKGLALTQMGAARALGLADDAPKPAWFQSEADVEKQIKKDNERPLVKEIARVAEGITECVLLKDLLGVKGEWGTAAAVIAYMGDPRRFPTVAAMWHYAGFHVVNGVAPKRAKGQNISYSPRLRTALWLWAVSMIKTGNPRWQPAYEKYRDDELAVHLEKHPGCKTVDGHSGARARRRVIKDVLKEYFRLTNGGIEGSGHYTNENQNELAAPKSLKKPSKKLKKVA